MIMMIMPSAPCDIYDYRAALLEWHQVQVGQTQRMYWAKDSSTLLQIMTEDVLRYANLLSHRYATAIDAADLSIINDTLPREASQQPCGIMRIFNNCCAPCSTRNRNF